MARSDRSGRSHLRWPLLMSARSLHAQSSTRSTSSPGSLFASICALPFWLQHNTLAACNLVNHSLQAARQKPHRSDASAFACSTCRVPPCSSTAAVHATLAQRLTCRRANASFGLVPMRMHSFNTAVKRLEQIKDTKIAAEANGMLALLAVSSRAPSVSSYGAAAGCHGGFDPPRGAASNVRLGPAGPTWHPLPSTSGSFPHAAAPSTLHPVGLLSLNGHLCVAYV